MRGEVIAFEGRTESSAGPQLPHKEGPPHGSCIRYRPEYDVFAR